MEAARSNRTRHRALAVAVSIGAGSLALLAAAPAAFAADPPIGLSDLHGPAGRAVAVSGMGCSIDHNGVAEPGTARVEMVAGASTLAAVASGTGPGGQWQAHLDIPSTVAPGAYRVTALCIAVDSGGLLAKVIDYQPTTYTVDPT